MKLFATIYLDEDVSVAVLEKPSDGIVHSSHDSGFIGQILVLPEIEQAENHHHPELVGLVQDPR